MNHRRRAVPTYLFTLFNRTFIWNYLILRCQNLFLFGFLIQRNKIDLKNPNHSASNEKKTYLFMHWFEQLLGDSSDIDELCQNRPKWPHQLSNEWITYWCMVWNWKDEGRNKKMLPRPKISDYLPRSTMWWMMNEGGWSNHQIVTRSPQLYFVTKLIYVNALFHYLNHRDSMIPCKMLRVCARETNQIDLIDLFTNEPAWLQLTVNIKH